MSKTLKTTLCTAALTALALALPQAASAQSIVDKVKQRGYVSCGASQGVPGLSRPDEKGEWKGFDSDVCRAVAVAVLQPPWQPGNPATSLASTPPSKVTTTRLAVRARRGRITESLQGSCRRVRRHR